MLGAFLWIQYLCQTLGLKYTTASSSGFITGLFIIFVPLFSLLFFRRKPKAMQLIALGVALCGLWFLTGGLKDINIGDLLTFITAISIGLYILVIDKFVKEKKSIIVLNFQQFFVCTILSFVTILVFRLPLSIGGGQALAPILYLAIFGNAVGQGLMLLCQRYLKPVTSSLLLSTEPVFAASFSWTLGGEIFVPLKAIGGLFIVASIFLSEIPLKPKRQDLENNIMTYER
jgi:drug/metabolite transporter (DMT)-like permease